MDIELLVLRVVHVCLGVFWAGTVVFQALFLAPSVKEAGPDGAKVMAGLLKRQLLNVLPATAVLTIVTGLRLMMIVSHGGTAAWLRTGPGTAYGLGLVVSVAALALGLGVLRPSIVRAAALSQGAASATADERERLLQQAQASRARAKKAGEVVAILLVVATITMAVARYL
jgi:beta-lactamase regulating signal transducer with metallopeptidase domain